MPRKTFPDISTRAYEHPADKAATSVLKQTPGLPQVLDFIGSFTSDRSLRIYFLSNSIKVSNTQLSDIHHLVQEGCSILDVQDEPEVYVTNNPYYNAMAVGFKKPYLVLHSSLVKNLSSDELLNVIGHELGHIKSGHIVYSTILWILANISLNLMGDVANLFVYPVVFALKDWARKAELTADRAGLLTVQDPMIAYSTEAKLMAGGAFKSLDMEEVMKQADEYDAYGDIIDSAYKFMNVMWASHPMGMSRLRELRRWVDSGIYQRILDGEYTRNDTKAEPFKDFEEAVKQFEDDLKTSEDPGAKLASQLWNGAQQFGQNVASFFGGLGGTFGGTGTTTSDKDQGET
jgi:Zn-dependent protease with chaperone function